MNVWSNTHIGLVRVKNEDSFLVMPQEGLFAVADGMGGHRAGELASGLAISRLREIGEEHASALPFVFGGAACQGQVFMDQAIKLMSHSLNETISELNDTILLNSCQLGLQMGTTIVILWLVHHYAFVACSGDSSIFRCRQGITQKLSVDHVNSLGLVGGLGVQKDAVRNVFVHTRQQGDLYLLCSDGVTTHIHPENEIPQMMAMIPPNQLVPELIRVALARGGKDNITAIVVQDI